MTLRPQRLRSRLVLAMVGTSIATLAAATLTLLPPLEHRLERDQLDDLRQVARTARLGIAGLPRSALHPDGRDVRRLVRGLRVRAGGEVALLGPDGALLADTDTAGTTSAETGGLPRRDDVREGVRGDEAIVRAGAHARGGAHVTLVIRKPLADTRAAAAAVRDAVPLAALIGLLTGGVLAALASGGVLRRLRRLRDDARALHADGLAHPVAVDGVRDEVGEVARALEEMRGRLLREEAKRQEFLQVASHELRTPLATLQANLELLSEEAQGDARRRADGALRQTHRLVTLASDLLDLGRIDGGVRPSLQAIELGELAARLRDELGIPLAIHAPGPVHALADSVTVLRILGILVDNARVHGSGAISVTLATAGDEAVVAVEDEGPGLPEAERERLFERFVRGQGAQGRPGSGLGLAIARGLAEAMDGRLEAAGGARLELGLKAWADYPAATGAGRILPGAPGLLGTSQAASTDSTPTSTAATNAAV
jgi:signal transduction histidine kinase